MELLKVSGRIIKILLSVSLLSLLLSLLPFLFQSLNQFSINKTYVFLFCNGLMVLIAKNSALPSDSSSQFNDLDVAAPLHSQEHDMAAADSAVEQQQEEEEKRIIVADPQQEDEVADTEKEEEEGEEKRMIVADCQEEDEIADREKEEEEEEEKRMIVADPQQEDEVADTEKEKEEEEEQRMIVADCQEEDEIADTEKKEEEEEEGSNNGDWMTEEEVEDLNKKCEDFITKMKAAFCSDPFNHQAAMVTVR